MITTLVLGAGVSLGYNYPSGESLVDLIRERLHPNMDRNFLSALSQLRPYSIDQFLATKPEYQDKVKPIIADIIARHENKNNYSTVIKENDFYRFFFNKIHPDQYSNFRIITFNYDRSLEFRRSTAVIHQYPVPEFGPTFVERCERLKIVHVHGRLPKFDEESVDLDLRPNYHGEYGKYAKTMSEMHLIPGSLQREEISRSASHEFDRQAQTTFDFVFNKGVNSEAISFLEGSDRIFFLGFSYHEFNLEKIGISKIDLTKKLLLEQNLNCLKLMFED